MYIPLITSWLFIMKIANNNFHYEFLSPPAHSDDNAFFGRVPLCDPGGTGDVDDADACAKRRQSSRLLRVQSLQQDSSHVENGKLFRLVCQARDDAQVRQTDWSQ